jgi:hypothetical protein
MKNILTVISAVIGIVALVVGVSLLLAAPVMWLWDWLMPTLFGLKKITLCQAWGLMVLCGFLFKSNSVSKD